MQLSLRRVQLGVVHTGSAVGKADDNERARNIWMPSCIHIVVVRCSSDGDEVKVDDCRGRVDDGKVHDKRDARQIPAARAFTENTTTTTPTPATSVDSTLDTQVQ